MRLILVCLAAITCCPPVFGQGMRISTHIYDVAGADANGREPVLASCLTLFHNGRVYDYMESADEVVIFDSTERRFVILNMARELWTTVEFEEMNHLLKSRVPTTERYISELRKSGQPSAVRAADSLQFQLHPEFRTQYDATSGRLLQSSPLWTYRVQTREWQDADQVERYLNYTDWAKRLNYIMRPTSSFPEPRLALNNALRELKDRMPVSVEQDMTPGEPVRIRADHRITIGLSDDDRRRVSRWEDIRRHETFRKMAFRSYLETVLISEAR